MVFSTLTFDSTAHKFEKPINKTQNCSGNMLPYNNTSDHNASNIDMHHGCKTTSSTIKWITFNNNIGSGIFLLYSNLNSRSTNITFTGNSNLDAKGGAIHSRHSLLKLGIGVCISAQTVFSSSCTSNGTHITFMYSSAKYGGAIMAN